MNLRKDTARTIVVGPILDADGAAKTNEMVSSILASKNGSDPAALDGSATLTHKACGMYRLALTANDTDTLGCLEIILNSTTNAMPAVRLNIATAAAWDALYAASGGYLLVKDHVGNPIATETTAAGRATPSDVASALIAYGATKPTDLAGLATTTNVTNAVAGLAKTTDLAGLATATNVTNAVSGLATSQALAAVAELIAGFASEETVSAMAETIVAIQAALDAIIVAGNGMIGNEAVASTVYTSEERLKTLFGTNNINQWADVDNDQDAETIAARLDWACSAATSLVNDTLRDGPYAVPFDLTAVPTTIIDATTRIAAAFLYDSRGIQDSDPNTGEGRNLLAPHKKAAEYILQQILAGKLTLNVATTTTNIPKVVAG
jgi:hypothetical protein